MPIDSEFNSTQSGTGRGAASIVEDVQHRVKDDAAAMVDVAKRDLGTVRDEVQDQAQELVEEAKTQLGDATEKVKSIAADQKDYLAEQLAEVASAVTRVADELGSKQTPTAGYARTLADGLQNFSKTVGDRDVDSLMGLAEDFGRKQPAAFMGAAALAGFVASRFLMASGQRRTTSAPSSAPVSASPMAPSDYPAPTTGASGGGSNGGGY